MSVLSVLIFHTQTYSFSSFIMITCVLSFSCIFQNALFSLNVATLNDEMGDSLIWVKASSNVAFYATPQSVIGGGVKAPDVPSLFGGLMHDICKLQNMLV